MKVKKDIVINLPPVTGHFLQQKMYDNAVELAHGRDKDDVIGEMMGLSMCPLEEKVTVNLGAGKKGVRMTAVRCGEALLIWTEDTSGHVLSAIEITFNRQNRMFQVGPAMRGEGG